MYVGSLKFIVFTDLDFLSKILRCLKPFSLSMITRCWGKGITDWRRTSSLCGISSFHFFLFPESLSLVSKSLKFIASQLDSMRNLSLAGSWSTEYRWSFSRGRKTSGSISGSSARINLTSELVVEDILISTKSIDLVLPTDV